MSVDTDPIIGLPVPNVSTASAGPRPAASRRALALILAGGVTIDVALHAGGVGVAAAAALVLMAPLLAASGAVRGRVPWLAVASVVTIAPWLALRADGSIQLLDVAACVALLSAAVLARQPADADAIPVPDEATVVAHGMVSAFDGPRYALAGAVRSVSTDAGRHRTRAFGRGIAIAAPVLLVAGGLLASADSSFASLVRGDSMWTAVGHVVLASLGAAAIAGLVRAGLVARRAPEPSRPVMGGVEAAVVLGLLAVLYAGFVLARLRQTPVGAGARALSDEARAGFFQLVAVAVLTVLVLVAIRVLAGRRRAVVVPALVVVALTMTLVGIALHRLDKYSDGYGLTPLRMATTWFSVWLGVVVAVVGLSYVVTFSPRTVAAAIGTTAVVGLVGWNAVDPDAHIARVNLDRAVDGLRFDAAALGELSADAVPVIVDRLEDLDPNQRELVVMAMCANHTDRSESDGLGWNRARAEAADAVRRVCPVDR